MLNSTSFSPIRAAQPSPQPAIRFAGKETPKTANNAQPEKTAKTSHSLTKLGVLLTTGLAGVFAPMVSLSAAPPVGTKQVAGVANEKKAEYTTVIEVTDQNFEKEVLNSDVPVLLKFGAPWCGPCVRMEPELKALAADGKYNTRIKVAHINIDNNPKTTAAYAITGIPDTRLFKKIKADDKANKAINESKVGYHTKGQLAEWVDQQVPAAK